MPAVQNLMLAARGLGLGTCLTTVANIYEGKMKELLLGVVPSDVVRSRGGWLFAEGVVWSCVVVAFEVGG